MSASPSRPCPSCNNGMEVHTLPALYQGQVEIDFCFGCQGIWFDQMENLKLTPAAIATVFKAMHRHRGEPRMPLAGQLRCAECRDPLTQGFDVVRSGRYITHRCASRHGRFSSFSSFMIEKGFVRQLTRPEIDDIAKKVGSIRCSACGAPVDLRKEDACSHCRTALSLLDPHAVEQALQRYSQAPERPAWGTAQTDVADAILAMAKERSRAQRNSGAQTAPMVGAFGMGLFSVDLFSVGLDVIAGMLDS